MHAMIITAYRDAAGLRRMAEALSRHALCYIHADLKGEITERDVRSLGGIPGVTALRRYRVNWGSVLHLRALLDLMRLALQRPDVTHLHLVSAQDFPCVSHEAFARFFEGDDRIHMQMIRTADYPELVRRAEHYHFMHLLDYRDARERVQNWVGRLDRWQDALHVKRRLALPWKGLVWLSLPRAAAGHALLAPRNRRLLRRLRYAYIPEEFYFQNAFAGTPWEERITGNALRFSVWDEPERGTPALLDERDLPAVDASGCLFCRKVNADSALYETLEARWLSGS